MNLNQSLIQKKTVKNGFGFSASNVKHLMGPPVRPPPKPRGNRHKTSSTTSSGTNWGKSCVSVFNNSTLRSASTTISMENESRVIVALTEGRGDARCEVGLTSIDLSMPTLLLCQISDSQSYINTLTKINILNPTDIIVPTTFLECNNRLVSEIKKKFPNIKILGIPRKTFNKSNGMDRILQLCLPSINTICVGLQHKYYALAAASALTTYLQNNLNIYYAKASINVSYQESEGYAVIDVSTADRLELVSSTKPAQATRYSTLFGVLNHCVTKVGSRLLRSTILQPPSHPSIIEKTSQCVAELIKHPEVLLSIQSILQKISNIDQLLTLTSMTLGTTDGCSVRQLNYLLLLNSLVDLIEPLKDVIDKCQQPFFKDLKSTLESDNFGGVTDKIRTMIHPSAHFARSEAGITQRCFAIKSDINGLLDLVRKTYSERLNDLTEYVKHLGSRYNLPLTLGNNNAKGYHIVLKLTNQQKRTFKKSDLPSEFIQVYRLAGSFTMKTTELINYSTRLEDIMLEILKISNSMIYSIVVDLKQYLGFFYKLCEDIARLDMLQSLAEASRRGKYVRPKFGDFTELTNSRHPMLEMLIGDQRVANTISICQDFNVQVITGPNGSGKSIYIRQVMLLQVMAQVGCYVPADSAIFRPMNRMFARIYLEDDMEYGASSFILEMKEVKYMMTLLSESSLFIIDELCRSTAADEGAALAMAICEKFCSTSVFLYVTTHYTSLASIADMYLNVKTWQMETVATGDTPQELSLDFRFRLVPGVTNLKQYGVYIVKKIWPESILNEVYRILKKCKKKGVEKKYTGVNNAIRLKYKLESDLRKLKSVGKLTIATINKLLNDYQNELQKMDIFINLSLEPQNDAAEENRELSLEEQNNLTQYGRNQNSQNNNQNDVIESDNNELLLNGEYNMTEYQNTQLSLGRQYHDPTEYITSQNSFAFNLYNEAKGFSDERDFDDDVFETSSYQDLSNFLREDSDNINKLIPDVSLACSERQLILEENHNGPTNTSRSSRSSKLNNEEEFDIVENLAKSSSDVAQNRTKSSSEENKTQVTQWGPNVMNLSDADIRMINEELAIFSKSFLEDDDDFSFSQASSYHTANNEPAPRNNENQHIFPVVTVIPGPAWSSDSSQSTPPRQNDERNEEIEECEQNIRRNEERRHLPRQNTEENKETEEYEYSSRQSTGRNEEIEEYAYLQRSNTERVDEIGQYEYLSESISYSPLYSQSSNTEEEQVASKNSNQIKSSSSSLHFLARNDSKPVDVSDKVASSDTNMANISTIRDANNITVENLKSLSTEKASSSDEQVPKLTSTSSSSSMKESSKNIDFESRQVNTNHVNKMKRPKRFNPPKKLTRKEILEEFDEQDRKIYASDMSESNLSKLLAQKLNRPSVKQVQNSKHLAFVRKTDDGIQVIPAKPEPVKKKFPFKRKLSNSSNVDMTIFSDKNAKRFDEFLNSDERDVKRFKFTFDSQKQSHLEAQQFNFQPQSISEYAAAIEKTPFLFKSQNSEVSDNFHSLTPITPEGYYKQNKDDINNILNKYLREDGERFHINGCSNDLNIFETCSLNENDLVL